MPDAAIPHSPLHEPASFTDELLDWIDRSPFLAIALLIHAIAFFTLNMFPWEVFEKQEGPVLTAMMPQVYEEQFEELVEEKPEPIEPVDVTKPVIDDVTDVTSESTEDTNLMSDSTFEMPFDSLMNTNAAIGLGPGAGSGGPLGSRGRGRAGQPRPQAAAITAALDWLADHQCADGSWDADGFASECGYDGEVCNGEGDAQHDVGVTSLALLAFLGAGESATAGPYAETVRNGFGWLKLQLDSDTGEFEGLIGHDAMYDQALGALALAEGVRYLGDPLLAKRAQSAINFLLKARNPYGAWRYSTPADGDNDTSVTGWAILALSAAQESGLKVPEDAFRGALAWVNEVTDDAGVTGYNQRGGESSRLVGFNDPFPTDAGHPMTAAGVLTRAFCAKTLGGQAAETERMLAGAERLAERPPVWDADGGGGGDSGWQPGDYGRTNDMYYWYYGAYALHQVAAVEDKYWRAWSRGFLDMLVDNQRTAPSCYAGSWDPSGPWGTAGGRVYSTALLTLCLEVTYRYEQVLEEQPK